MIYIFLLWFVICAIIGIGTYFQNDHKFGTHNIQISLLMFVISFFSPVLLPISWFLEWRRDK